MKSPQGQSNSELLYRFENEVIPQLAVEQIFKAPQHSWKQRSPAKCKGGCPWHVSKSGTAFVVDTVSLQWYCAGCDFGGGPVQYLHRLRGGVGVSPRGEEFITILRELFDLAGVEFPRRELAPEEAEQIERRDARRAALQTVIHGTQERLWSDDGAVARAYLRTRGFSKDQIRELGFGLYSSASRVRAELVSAGHDSQSIDDASAAWPRLEGYIVAPWFDEHGRPLTLYGIWPEKTKTPPGNRPHKIALPNPKGEDGEDLERTKRSPYCFDRARRAGHTDVVIVEGVLDAALLQAYGDTRVIAPVAAQLSGDQVNTLARCGVKKATICLDPDSAGDRGIESCIRSLTGVGISTLIAPRLPDGQDPDEFVIEHGMEVWRTHIADAEPSAVYLARRMLDDITPKSNMGKRRDAVERVAAFVADLDSAKCALDIEQIVEITIARTGYKVGTIRKMLTATRRTAGAAPKLSIVRHSAVDTDIPYEASDRGLIWYKETRDGDIPVRLTNFLAEITGDIVEDDGSGEPVRLIEIQGTVCGRRAPQTFTVPAHRFGAMTWPVENLGPEAILFPGHALRDHARAAVQMLSRNVRRRTVFTHTGWRRVDGAWVFLHSGGAISANGAIDGVEVHLAEDLGRYQFPETPEGQDLAGAVCKSLELTAVAPDRIMIPILAAAYRAPLGPCRESLHLAGETGTGKTELVALAQQHFGAQMDAKHLPASWESTDNALEGIAFAAKDALLVIDDFAPGGTSYDVRRLHAKAARLFRGQGNRSGRLRMRANSTLRPTKFPRGLILSTGEDIPQGHSIRARTLIIEVAEGDIDWDQLTICQRYAAEAIYARAMAGYLQWLASRHDEVRKTLTADIAELRRRAATDGQHKRTPEIVADLAVGFRSFARFANEIGAITDGEAADLGEHVWKVLLAVGADQNAHHDAVDPVRRFFVLLSSALASGEAHVASAKGQEPVDPEAWGWRLRSTIGQNGAQELWWPQGARVGWVSGEDFLVDLDAAYRAVQQMAGASGTGIPITSRTLSKRLMERGHLKSTEAPRLTIRRRLEGRRRAVLHLSSGVLSPEVRQVRQLNHDPASEAEKADPGAVPRRTSEGDDAESVPEDCASRPPGGVKTEVSGAVGALGTVPGAYPPGESGTDGTSGRVEIVI